VTAQERAHNQELWKARVTAFKESNQSLAKWCRDNNIKKSTLYSWIKKLKEKEELTPRQWMSMTISSDIEAPSAKRLLIRIGKAEIEVQPDFDPSMLVKVVQTLSEL
jgi:transposase-like protein